MNPLRKPKLHFDVVPNPSHISFDDAKVLIRVLPWSHYVCAQWDYAEPDVIKFECGEWLTFIHGRNLAPLLRSIEERTLTRVRAQPELTNDPEREGDSIVAELRFIKVPSRALRPKPGEQTEFDLPDELI
jgi:hypothetical protein